MGRLRNSGADEVRDQLDNQRSHDAADDPGEALTSVAGKTSDVDNLSFRQVVEAIPEAVVIHRHGRLLYANPMAARYLGSGDPEALIGRPVMDFVAPEYRARLDAAIRSVNLTGEASDILYYERLNADGRRSHVETIATRITAEGGHAILNVCRDVTTRVQAELALRESEARFRTFAEHSPEAIFAICDQRIVIANHAAADLLGVDDPDMLLGRDAYDFCHPTMRDWAHRNLHALASGEAHPKQCHGRLCRADGGEVDAEWTSIPFDFAGRPAAYLILRDVTERLKDAERHRFLATHDPLTGLPNRFDFRRSLASVVEEAKKTGAVFAVHYLDLDYFKTINDTLGHHIGDSLLQTVATRLECSVRAADIVARLGGDEFAVLQRDVGTPDAPLILAKKLQEAVEQPFTIGDEQLHTSITVGIALFPEHGDDPENLLRRADLALYQAKDRGRNAVSFFNDELDVQVRERDRLITELVRAEARGEFDIFFQPIANLSSGKIDAVEALLRWRHPERGLLPADAFIHAIEVSREAQRIGAWVLRKSCEYASGWKKQNISGLRVAVNLSMPLLQRPDLVDLVKSCLDDFALDPEQLELELTERMVITSGSAGLEKKLFDLHDLGVHLALDDFGTGFSSLALLKGLPIDRIKIDRSFVSGFGSNADDTAIVRAVTNLAHAMNKWITAEGVESSEILELLRGEGCHEIQGFHLARPMPAADLARFVKTYRHDSSAAVE